MNTKAIMIRNKDRIVFWECDGKYYVIIEQWKKKHWVEESCAEVSKELGNKFYKLFLKEGFKKCSKEYCARYVR